MIDFMANIKNKKNMTKCNIKTLMATSVLCVFFNGALIYGMEGNTPEDVNNNKNEQNNNNNNGPQNKPVVVIKKGNVNNDQEPKNNNNLDKLETPIPKYLKEEDLNSHKKLKKGKNNGNNIFFNYKDHFSLFFCCNLCNDKEYNRNKYLHNKRLRKYDNLAKNDSNQAEEEINSDFKKENDPQGEEKPGAEEQNVDANDEEDSPKL